MAMALPKPVSSNARFWFGLTAVVAIFAIALEIGLVAFDADSFFANPWSRGFNVLFFFTTGSNILVAVSCGLIWLNPHRDSALFRVLRLTSVAAITVTGVAYHSHLAAILALHGWDRVADILLHTGIPIMTVLGWLIFGPRGLTSRRVVGLSLIFPALYLPITLIRGPIVDWYPYPFMNPDRHGYRHVARDCTVVAAFYLCLSVGANALDAWMTRRASSDAACEPGSSVVAD